MAPLEDEFSGKFGRPVRKEDVPLGQRWPGTWDLSVGFGPLSMGKWWENVGNSSSFGWNFYEIVGKEVIFAMGNCDNII
jgi:hypothetical protein